MLECFTFLKMGGDPSRVVLYPTTAAGTDAAENRLARVARAVMTVNTLEQFDANQAQCFKTEEKEHMLGIIETGFGSLHEFNRVMQAHNCLERERPRPRHSPSVPTHVAW